MIQSFRQSWLKDLGHWKAETCPDNLKGRLIRKLDMLNTAKALRDLSSSPSNNLHPLHGDRLGEWAISVNGPWRLCFRFEGGDIFDIELVQYH